MRTQALTRIGTFLLDILFPAYCVGCQCEGSFLCPACAEHIVIRRVPDPRMIPGLSVVYAAADYHDPRVAALVQLLKYDKVYRASIPCALFAVSHLALAGYVPGKDTVIVPVPLSARRLRERGFNQSALIAKELASRFSLSRKPRALVRTRHTTPQTEMPDTKERKENVKGAFICRDAEAVRGKEVLLVDDVLSTGATLSECAQALKKAGAKRIFGVVVAH